MQLVLFYFIILQLQLYAYSQVDPSEFFQGSQHRPKLIILHPENGEVLDTVNLDIRVRIDGYQVPSHFHDSKVCIALSSGRTDVAEKCFDQSEDLFYQANGLTPGAAYTLRVLFSERGRAIAMSVRSFRVAGILGVLEGQDETPVTIRTALQVALHHQTSGSSSQAERIYRMILSESPSHPYALHLLGVVFYQKGDPLSAIPYIEKALLADSSEEGFHNTLGECYRILGRYDDAKQHFETALSLTPEFTTALFNLALLHQQLNHIDEAIGLYRRVIQLEDARSSSGSSVDRRVRESVVRECDLLHLKVALGGAAQTELLQKELDCWTAGAERLPDNGLILNEIGNVFVKRGQHEKAQEAYTKAASLGYFLAELNVANVLEMRGFAHESRSAFFEAVLRAEIQDLPHYHVRIRLATVVPRVLPASDAELRSIRDTIELELDALLAAPAASIHTESSPPINHGFSLGYYLMYHGFSDLSIKMKLFRVYSRFCPALLFGHFIDGVGRETVQPSEEYNDNLFMYWPATSALLADVEDAAMNTEIANMTRSSVHHSSMTAVSSNDVRAPVRIGIASRYFYSHAVGYLLEGLIPVLATGGFEVILFYIDANNSLCSDDSVQSTILRHAHTVHYLAADLPALISTIRDTNVDVLLFPEIGMDPITYFAAFARLAPVQAAWVGHPDTTGIGNMDYFISGDVELEEADMQYSEGLIRMPMFGTCFVDRYLDTAISMQLPRTALLERAKFIEAIHLPRAAHLYVIAQPLYALHSSFDEIIVKILLQDKLGHIVIVDSVDRPAWRRLLVDRVTGRFSDEVKSRIVFYHAAEHMSVVRAMTVAHVVLDPSPASNYLSTLLALSLGTPVITWPSQRLAGRMALALYRAIGYNELIVDSPVEYVSLALSISHKPKLRQMHVNNLMSLRQALFNCSGVADHWHDFVSKVHQTHIEADVVE